VKEAQQNSEINVDEKSPSVSILYPILTSVIQLMQADEINKIRSTPKPKEESRMLRRKSVPPPTSADAQALEK
jgi:hypothetical protein